jgi:CheY-like chemotaxis protein
VSTVHTRYILRNDARPHADPTDVLTHMMSILVADDAPGVRKLLRTILEPMHHVIEAADGGEALRRLGESRPHIVILDVMMPELSGIEVCRRLRQDPKLASTPVVMITANGTPTDRAAALDAGADYFLTKPFSPTVMLRLVDTIRAERASSPIC